MAIFILEDALCVWTNLGKHSLFVSSVKTGTRRIIRPDELSSVGTIFCCALFKSHNKRPITITCESSGSRFGGEIACLPLMWSSFDFRVDALLNFYLFVY